MNDQDTPREQDRDGTPPPRDKNRGDRAGDRPMGRSDRARPPKGPEPRRSLRVPPRPAIPPRRGRGGEPGRFGRPLRTLTVWAFIFMIMLVGIHFVGKQQREPEVTYTWFREQIEKSNIESVTILEKEVRGRLRDTAPVMVGNRTTSTRAFKVMLPSEDPGLPDLIWKTNPGIEIAARPRGTNWVGAFFSWFPILLLLGFWIFFMRQMQVGGNRAFSFGKSRARLLTGDRPKVTFADVAGATEAKQELREIIEFLKDPRKFQKLGGRIPKGALLLGAPGTGKTLLARAVAGEAGVPFFSMSGSDFVEMFVGVGASRVRDLFEQGKRHAPCLTGDAVVTLANGQSLTIEQMFNDAMIGAQVPAMGEDFGLTTATVLGITRKRSADVRHVRLMHGDVRATGNHLFPVLRDGRVAWTRADELEAGDYVAVPRRLPTAGAVPRPGDLLPPDTRVYLEDLAGRGRRKEFVRLADLGESELTRANRFAHGSGGWTDAELSKVPDAVSPRLLYLVGLIDADGSWKQSRSIPFVNTCDDLHVAVATIVKQEFGISARRSVMRKAVGDDGTDVEVTHIHSRLMRDLLVGVRDRVLEMPETYIAAWLRGVFDGDGCVQGDKVIISAWDGVMNRRVRAGLHRLGILARDSGRLGNIEITGKEDAARFAEVVGSNHPQKADLLARAGRDGSRTASRSDAIPVGALLRAAREACGMGQRAFERGNYISLYERDEVTPSRRRLASVVDEMERWVRETGGQVPEPLQALRRLVDGDTRWTRVMAVDDVPGDHWVYDLCLDGPHNFVANGLFVHNCIIFIDEIDAVGRWRGAGLGGGHDEREQTLNQLLVEMDGFESNDGVILVAATNRPDVLDPALLRPGRFDRQIVVDMPDVKGREGILRVHTKKVPLAQGVSLRTLARGTPGLSGADLANLVNEGALLAARRNHTVVTMADLEDAKDKVMMGPERKSMVIREEDRRVTAYHEAGHVLVGALLPGSDPIHKVTIIPRGRALGLTWHLPEDERYTYSKEYYLGVLARAMGGRAAEKVAFNEISTGAAGDIVKATTLARKMVCEWGMSEAVGPLTYGEKEEQIFLGREISQRRDYSEQTAVLIDREVRAIVEGAQHRAEELLSQNIDKLRRLAEALLEFESLDKEDIERILKGEGIRRQTKRGPRNQQRPEAGAGDLQVGEAAGRVRDEPVPRSRPAEGPAPA